MCKFIWLLFGCFWSFIFKTFANNKILFRCFSAVETFLIFFTPLEFLDFFASFFFDFIWITLIGWIIGFVERLLLEFVDVLSLIINPAYLSRFRFLGCTNSNSDNFTIGWSKDGSGFGLSLFLPMKRMFVFCFALHKLQVVSWNLDEIETTLYPRRMFVDLQQHYRQVSGTFWQDTLWSWTNSV